MKKRFLIIFLGCLACFVGFEIYSSLHSGIDANSLKKIDGFSIWRAKDEKGKLHFVFEYCRFDNETAVDTKILRCKTLN